jgi:predicted metal-dependent peptidase
VQDQSYECLEQAVRRQAEEESAGQRVSQARTKLVLGKDARSAFFAVLALRMKVAMRWDVETFATDGEDLFVNPRFAASLTAAEVEGVLCHEVLHCALGHHVRRGSRDRQRWNVACDLAVNPLLLEAGFTLPASRLLPNEGEYAGLPTGRSAEEYYTLLPNPGARQDERGCEAATGGRGGDPGGCGSVLEPGTGTVAEQKESAARWQVAVAQAELLAQQRGKLPGALDRVVTSVLQPAVAWQDVLREFVTQTAHNDYRWSPPNRRFAHIGLYLPQLSGETLGDVVLAIDTSGSIGQELLDRFGAETQSILDAYDVTLHVVYHDAAVQHVQQWRSSDGPLTLEPKGGGGTSHVPVFEWIATEGVEPSCVVCLTDLYTEFPRVSPSTPVLWAVVGTTSIVPPFGERLYVG